MVDHKDYAARIRAAYTGQPLAPIRFAEPLATMNDGYAIQTLNRNHWVQSGRRIVGAKIGLTSKAVQQQLGVDQPDFGVLFADMQVGEQDGVPAGRLLQPKVEAEIAFVLSRDIDADDENSASLADAIAYALPALEIVDSRIADWDIKMVDTIADNASAGLFVLGTQPVDIRSLDLATCTMQLEKNGARAAEGSGAACLGNPLNALAWLASMRIIRGEPLKAGNIILSGALGPMVPATSGDCFQAQIEGIGSIGIRFAPYPNVSFRGPR